MTESLVKKAAACLADGDLISAQRIYQQAGERYGHGLFSANIKLCRKRIEGEFQDKQAEQQARIDSPEQPGASALEQQLELTQEMLEYYYIRCQELEAQLLEVKSE